MNEQLLLENIRGVLIRMEETIIFALIERAQFKLNAVVYEPDRFGAATAGQSLLGYMLLETERLHARMRRYTSPDEHPFNPGLPEPILPCLRYDESPLHGAAVINHNAALRQAYEREIVPRICQPGDDAQYGSAATCDVACLQALSRRIHYGMFVAESKFHNDPAGFAPLIQARDTAGLLRRITHPEVEERLLRRVEAKARTYGQDLDGRAGQDKLPPACVVDLYRHWILPLTKAVEVEYLLKRPLPA